MENICEEYFLGLYFFCLRLAHQYSLCINELYMSRNIHESTLQIRMEEICNGRSVEAKIQIVIATNSKYWRRGFHSPFDVRFH